MRERLMSGWGEPRRGWDRSLGTRGHVQEGTASSLCENAVTLGRHFLSSVAPGTMGRAAFCRGNEGGMGAAEVWKERREEKERVEMEEKRRLKFLRYATVILSWILLDEV